MSDTSQRTGREGQEVPDSGPGNDATTGHGGTVVFVGLVQDDITFRDPEFHRRELTLPDVGVLQLVDPETGQVEQVRTSARTRERYAAAAAARAQAQHRAVLSAGASHAVVHTDQDWLPQLARALAVRRRVRGARPAGVP